MMRLKYLFHNPDLAEMLLQNWDYDRDSLDLFRDFRISANAVYPFRQFGGMYFLRFCPAAEKTEEHILAELAFINYLRSRQYPALEPVRARNGQQLVSQNTPWGTYYAVAFKAVPGKALDEVSLNAEKMYACGLALGRLHQLSNAYHSQTQRTYETVLDWMAETLTGLGGQGEALAEAQLLHNYFSLLPRNKMNFGLIHYDFEMDNVFYDENTKTCSVIDFDDAMQHWYMMDIVQTLDSLGREVSAQTRIEAEAAFLQGYQCHFAIDEEIRAAVPGFQRFGDLYRYTRIARAIEETWEHEPDWIRVLRKKLQSRLQKYAAVFGKELDKNGVQS